MSMRQWISKAYEQYPHGKLLLGREFTNFGRHPHEKFLLGSRTYAADAAAKPDVASKIAEKPIDEAGHDGANAVTGAPRTSEAAPSDPIGEEMRADTFVNEDIEVKHEGQWADTMDNVVGATKRVVGGAVDKIKEVAAGSDNSVADAVGDAAGDAAAGPAAGAVAGGAAAAAAESMGAKHDKHKDVKS